VAFRQRAQNCRAALAVRPGDLNGVAREERAAEIDALDAGLRRRRQRHLDGAFVELADDGADGAHVLAARGHGPVRGGRPVAAHGELADEFDDGLVVGVDREQQQATLGVDAQTHQQGGNSSHPGPVGIGRRIAAARAVGGTWRA
jgi:hypothetical protein